MAFLDISSNAHKYAITRRNMTLQMTSQEFSGQRGIQHTPLEAPKKNNQYKQKSIDIDHLIKVPLYKQHNKRDYITL